MKITVSFSSLRQSIWREIALRFGLGGLITALAGLVAAGADAAGAALGTLGLMAFASVVWAMADDHPAWIVLGSGSVAWIAVAVSTWMIRKHF